MTAVFNLVIPVTNINQQQLIRLLLLHIHSILFIEYFGENIPLKQW